MPHLPHSSPSTKLTWWTQVLWTSITESTWAPKSLFRKAAPKRPGNITQEPTENYQQVRMMTICWWLMVFFSGGFQHLRSLASILSSSWWFLPTHLRNMTNVKLDHVPPKISGQTYKIKIKRWKKPPTIPKVANQKCPTDSVYGWEVQGMTQHDSLEGQVLLPTPVVNRTRWYPPLMKGCGFPTSRKALSCLCPPSCLPTKTTPPHSERRGDYLRGYYS